MNGLRKMVLESDTKAGRIFDITIQILIAISLISFSIETLPDLSTSTYEFLANIEIVIVLIFSVEYVLRVVLTEKKLSYVFSFYGVVDLVAVKLHPNLTLDLHRMLTHNNSLKPILDWRSNQIGWIKA